MSTNRKRKAQSDAPEEQLEEPPQNKRTTRSKNKVQEPAPAAPKPPKAKPADRGRGRKGREEEKGPEREGRETPVAAPAPAQPEERPKGLEQKKQDIPEAPAAPPMDRDEDMDNGANSALQGLLRKLGAGFEDLMAMSMMSGGRFKAIITNLRQVDDEASQLGALTELCEVLSISSEDTLASFPIETMVPLLVQCLNSEHNADIMLLAARALTFMADVLPNSCGAIVRHGAVAAFCQRLLSIEYIDLAEQSLQGLEKLSHDHPHALLQQGGLLAVLSYLDFFPTGVQRVAVSTAANICRGLTGDSVAVVQEAVPMLTNILQYQDAKVVDGACMALSHIAEALGSNPSLLPVLSGGNLIPQVLQLVTLSETGTSTLSLSTYYGLVKLLATCAAGSPAVARQLLDRGVLGVVRGLLSGSSLLPNAGSSASSSMLRSADQLFLVLSLTNDLLPPLPDATSVVQDGLPALPDEAVLARDDRTKALKEDGTLMSLFCSHLLPLLLQLYSATVMPQVRHKCLGLMVRILAVAPPAVLSEALRELAISSFVASLLAARDGTTAAHGVHMAEILIEKLPQVMRTYFVKEGVVFGMEQLCAQPPGSGPTSPAPAPAQAPAAAPAPAPGSGSGSGSGPSTAAAAGTSGAGPQKVTRSSSRLREALKKDEPSAATSSGAASGAATANASAPAAPPAPPPPAAPAAAPAPPTRTASSSAAAGLRAALVARAQKFRTQHFGGAGSSKLALETEGLAALREVSSKLDKDPAAVQQLLDLMAAGTGVGGAGTGGQAAISVFELVNSGAVRQLCNYLQGSDLPQGPGKEKALLQRLRAFVGAALAPDSGTSPQMLALVRKLQGALSSVETFPVLVSRVHATAGSAMGAGTRYGASGSFGRHGSMGGAGSLQGGSSLSSGLAALAQPFKLRLCRHANERQLREYSSNIVLIEPLASMTAIEDFLWPRVHRPGMASSPSKGDVTAAEPAAPAAPSGAGAGGSKDKDKDKAPTATGRAGTSPPAGRGSAGASGAAGRGERGGRCEGAAAVGGRGPSKAQPIPDAGGNRRITRAQAARARAEAQASAEQQQGMHDDDEEEDEEAGMGRMHEEDEEDLMMEEEEEAEGEGHEGMDDDGMRARMEVPDHDGMFDDEDDDYEEEMGDDDNGALDIGPMHVHDLHVDDAAAGGGPAGRPGADAARGASGAAAAAGTSGAGSALAASAAAAARPNAWGAAARSGAAAGTSAEAAGAAAAVRAELPRLVFYMGTEKLSASTTVFQAIQQMQQASNAAASHGDGEEQEEGSEGRGRRLWDGVHTLHYRTADASDVQAAATSASDTFGSSGMTGVPLCTELAQAAARAGVPLGTIVPVQEVHATSLPSELSASEACKDVLALLKVLEVVNRMGPRMCGVAESEEASSGAGDSREHSPGGGCAATPMGVDKPVYGHVPREALVSSKLSSKLTQQLKDVLAICGGGLPHWCRQLVFASKHLFPFDVRRRYFYCTAFGLGRALQHMQAMHVTELGGAAGAASADAREGLRVGRLQRQKVRVSRKRILESAIKVMELYARQRAVLELEYFGEVGTGLGPTLEFYTLLSHDLQRRSLEMWRHEDAAAPAGGDAMDVDKPVDESAAGAAQLAVSAGRTASGALGQRPAAAVNMHVEAWHDDSQYVNAPWGLFPSPLPPGQRASSGKVASYFCLLGRTLAKALQDNRLMDLPLNYTFYRAALGQRLDMYDIAHFDPQLGAQLEKMWAALQAAQRSAAPAPPVPAAPTKGKGSSAAASKGKGAAAAAATREAPSPSVLIDGVGVEDLCLTFTLPGFPDYELVPDGSEVAVTSANLGKWIEAVVDATLGSGIGTQIEAFRAGFNEVFPLRSLDCFYEDEVEMLLCGAGEHWTVQSLAEAIKFDHGYTVASPVGRALLEVLAELEPLDQRRFLRFVTGCPRLPPGGLSSLQPRLTVVRKHPSGEKSGSLGNTPVGSLAKDGTAIPGGGTPLADGDLPSVMTCANYIKLPPYSSKDVLRERLLFAIREGQGSFDLS